MGGILFHGSPHLMAVGTILKPGIKKKNYRQSQNVVSLTSRIKIAELWGSNRGKQSVYVYEVEPLGEVNPHKVFWLPSQTSWYMDEGTVSAARIIKLVLHKEYTKKGLQLTPREIEALQAYAKWGGNNWLKEFEEDWLAWKNLGKKPIWPGYLKYWKDIQGLMDKYAWKWATKKVLHEVGILDRKPRIK